MSPREAHATRRLAEDEARLDGKYVGDRAAGRRTNQTLGEVFAEFWRHPSPYLLGTCLSAALVGRVISGPGSWWELAIPLGLGAVLPVVEWLVHVFVLHWRPRRLGPLTLDPLLARKHRAHHADPRAIPLVFIPWRAQLWLAPAWTALAWLVTPTTTSMLTLLVAIYAITSAYEWTHYLLHSDYRPRSASYRRIWRNHRLHHYKSEHYWFTVTSAGTADRLFGTAPDPATVPTSPTVQRLHDLAR
ncbi:sterol desaturase family protein [Nocardioides albidus]|uniref:Sterol desaturase family protein n=1 Tax=Nocardioides albidus TaxID=1517589 RepID=A0A5C4VRH5_9ACTN|nr:sterol desaturase family protein [Nocardioides albidus]TNM38457.1 sterol desaturase family protein [Nocardioides albidus]